jgi:hypothetical protein
VENGTRVEMKYLKRWKEAEVQGEEFLALERSLREHLIPVGPDDAFRRNLGKRLVAVAHHRHAGQDVILAEPGNPRKALLEAAVVGSLFSVVGLVAFLLRSHWERSSLPLR